MDWSNILANIWGLADERTEKEVRAWREADAGHEALYRQAQRYYAGNPVGHGMLGEEELEERWRRVREGLREREGWNEAEGVAEGVEGVEQTGKRGRRLCRRWGWTGVAASVAVLLAVGVWWHAGKEGGVVGIPGGEQLLAGGVVVVMEGGKRVRAEELQGGGRLSYLREGQGEEVGVAVAEQRLREDMHTVVVPRGNTFEVELSDGTRVVLEPESEMTYPVRFGEGGARKVTLRGEAFFEVAKSERRFVVHTERMKVQVYGTVFNVVTDGEREGASDEVVLVEGCVGVTPVGGNGGSEVVMQPGERSEVSAEGKVTVEEADVAEYIAKRNGYILFNGKTVNEILYELERYYDVDFTAEGELPLDGREYVVSVSRKGSLREALDALELVSEVEFTITGKEVEVTRN